MAATGTAVCAASGTGPIQSGSAGSIFQLLYRRLVGALQRASRLALANCLADDAAPPPVSAPPLLPPASSRASRRCPSFPIPMPADSQLLFCRQSMDRRPLPFQPVSGSTSQWYSFSYPVSFLHLIECAFWEFNAPGEEVRPSHSISVAKASHRFSSQRELRAGGPTAFPRAGRWSPRTRPVLNWPEGRRYSYRLRSRRRRPASPCRYPR